MLTNQIMLLKIVSSNGSLLALLKRGLSHSQIAMLINEQITNGNLESSLDGLCLTEKGKKVLQENFERLDIRGADSWILPQDFYYTDQIDPEAIILPKKI